jgi:hypothetical protein
MVGSYVGWFSSVGLNVGSSVEASKAGALAGLRATTEFASRRTGRSCDGVEGGAAGYVPERVS